MILPPGLPADPEQLLAQLDAMILEAKRQEQLDPAWHVALQQVQREELETCSAEEFLAWIQDDAQ